MSRRTGPGGRLRPAVRAHRNVARFDGSRPSGFLVPRVDAGPAGPMTGPPAGIRSLPVDDPRPDLSAVDATDLDRNDVQPHGLPPRETLGARIDPRGEVEVEVEAERTPVELRPAPPARQNHARPSNQRHGYPEQREAAPERHGPPERHGSPERPERPAGGPACTAPQLRRFIKSRAYVPMHELRRRFSIDGQDDDVTGVQLDGGCIYVGLPGPEGQMLGDLLRGGEVGFELSMDPQTPVVVGVYAMRPIPRT